MIKKYFSALIILIMFAFVGNALANDIPVDKTGKYSNPIFLNDDGGYLRNSTNGSATDTIGTATTNDTSYTFTNDAKYNYLFVEFYQNSTLNYYYIKHQSTGKVRFRYVAADSTLITEVTGLLGWIKAPIVLPDSTNAQMAYNLSLRTDNGILTIRGTNIKY